MPYQMVFPEAHMLRIGESCWIKSDYVYLKVYRWKRYQREDVYSIAAYEESLEGRLLALEVRCYADRMSELDRSIAKVLGDAGDVLHQRIIKALKGLET